jgi:hypothetical protein
MYILCEINNLSKKKMTLRRRVLRRRGIHTLVRIAVRFSAPKNAAIYGYGFRYDIPFTLVRKIGLHADIGSCPSIFSRAKVTFPFTMANRADSDSDTADIFAIIGHLSL